MHPARPYGSPRGQQPGRLYAHSPLWAVPPGEVLAEFLSESNMSRRQMAVRLQLPDHELDQLIEGATALTPELAARLEAATGMSAQLWTNLEANYRNARARQARRRRARLRLTAALSALVLLSAALSWAAERWYGYTGVLVVTGVVLVGGTALSGYSLWLLRNDVAELRRLRRARQGRQRASAASGDDSSSKDERTE